MIKLLTAKQAEWEITEKLGKQLLEFLWVSTCYSVHMIEMHGSESYKALIYLVERLVSTKKHGICIRLISLTSSFFFLF